MEIDCDEFQSVVAAEAGVNVEHDGRRLAGTLPASAEAAVKEVLAQLWSW